jgi:hypothetical protein
MSVLVTGVPTRNRAKRKLKTREEDPRGATYSARMYSRARVLPINCERLDGCESVKVGDDRSCTYMYKSMPSNHSGLNQSLFREDLGNALERTLKQLLDVLYAGNVPRTHMV